MADDDTIARVNRSRSMRRSRTSRSWSPPSLSRGCDGRRSRSRSRERQVYSRQGLDRESRAFSMAADDTIARVNRSRSLRRGRTSRSWSPPSLSPGWDGRRSRSRSRERPLEETASAIYLSMVFERGPVGQSLYALNLSQMDLLSTIAIDEQVNNPLEIPIAPLVEFPADEFPYKMSCVIFKSKLYLIGGRSRNLPSCARAAHSRDVYVIQVSSIPQFPRHLADATFMLSEGLIKKAASMHDGKPNCYTLVANGKIYALSTKMPDDPTLPSDPWSSQQPRFEVYDPDNNTWSVILPSPPFCTEVIFSAQFRSKLFFGAVQEAGLHCFDLVNHQWISLRPEPFFTKTFLPDSHAISVGGRLFWGCLGRVMSFGPSAEIQRQVEADTLTEFLHSKGVVCSPILRDAIRLNCGRKYGFTHLNYLGNMTFSYLLCGDYDQPPSCTGKQESRIILFAVPREETLSSSSSSTGEVLQEFTTTLLHVARLVCRSDNPVSGYVHTCCSESDFLNYEPVGNESDAYACDKTMQEVSMT